MGASSITPEDEITVYLYLYAKKRVVGLILSYLEIVTATMSSAKIQSKTNGKSLQECLNATSNLSFTIPTTPTFSFSSDSIIDLATMTTAIKNPKLLTKTVLLGIKLRMITKFCPKFWPQTMTRKSVSGSPKGGTLCTFLYLCKHKYLV